MPVLFGDGRPGGGIAGALALTTLKVGGLVLFTVVVGTPALDRLLNPAPVLDAEGVLPGSGPIDPRNCAVVVGYGPTGRTITRLLAENEIHPTVIELNVETVRALRTQRISAVYGDATLRVTLEAAGVGRANTLILTSAGMANGAEVIRTARALNPEVQVMARGSYLRDVPSLRAAVADTVFTGEGEVGLAFAEAVLRRLGATPEQVDRERSRARADLFGASDS